MRILLLITSIVCLVLQSAKAKNAELLDWLVAYDTEYLTAFGLSGHATMPLLPEMHYGSCHAEFVIAGSENELASQLHRLEPQPISFDDMAQDSHGNRLLPFNAFEYVMAGTNDTRILNEPQAIAISTTNSVIATAVKASSHLEIHEPTSQDAKNLIFRYILALGRGYSNVIESIDSIDTDASGMATVHAHGSLFSSHKGIWLLKIDTNREYLVSHAEFTRDGNTVPDFIASAGHYAKGPLYASGSVQIADYHLNVTDAQYVANSDNKTLEKVKAKVANGGSAGRRMVLDFRSINSDGMPLTKTE